MKFDTNTPHVEKDWVDAFVIELRLRSVEGSRIGEALAEIEAHCAESGESAAEAFGDPTAYAVELAPTSASDLDWRSELLNSGLGLVGMLVTLPGVAAWRASEQVEVSGGLILVVLLMLASTALLVHNAEPILRVLVKRWWLVALASFATVGLSVAILMLIDQTLFSVPAVGAIVGGCVLLAVSTVLSLRNGPDDDPIVGPKDVGGAGTVASDRISKGLGTLGPWLLPLFTLLMALPVIFFG